MMNIIRVALCVCCKQKTAYEMRVSDWSSDVCSSDRSAVHLDRPLRHGKCEGDLLVDLSARHQLQHLALPRRKRLDLGARPRAPSSDRLPGLEIGRAAWRERVVQYV